MSISISVRDLGKRYRLSHERATYGRLTESLSEAIRKPLANLRGALRAQHEWFWALRDVSFEVPRGEVFGVIGRNGAGKTTLLKILSRITEPTTGQALLRGRVGSLLEVGTGFHPELTGRENIFMSGTLLGMRREEIIQRFDEIVDFSGTEQFLDTPVKRYSSGMQVRLGFAVAAHLDTGILIVDEVLAVGDAAFQKKCLAKMGDLSGLGRTVLLVSHNMAAVEAMCSTAILLDQGQLRASGPVHQVVKAYLESVSTKEPSNLGERGDRSGNGRLRFTRVESTLRTGAGGELRLAYVADGPVADVAVAVGFFTSRGEGALLLSSRVSGSQFEVVPAEGVAVCRLDRTGLLPGLYTLNLYCTVNGVLADWVVDAARIEVADGDFFGTGRLPPPGYGSVAVEHHWTVESGNAHSSRNSDESEPGALEPGT